MSPQSGWQLGSHDELRSVVASVARNPRWKKGVDGPGPSSGMPEKDVVASVRCYVAADLLWLARCPGDPASVHRVRIQTGRLCLPAATQPLSSLAEYQQIVC